MPTISMFYGLVIQMYWQDHDPAHFHVRYGGDQAVIAIESGQVMRGGLPNRALALCRNGQNCIETNCWRIGNYVKPSKRRSQSSH